MKYEILSIIILSLFACRKANVLEPPMNPLMEESTDSLVIWQISLQADSSLSHSMDTELSEDGIIYSTKSLEVNESETIRLADRDNGDLLWSWNEYGTQSYGRGLSNYKVYDNLLVANANQYNYAINLTTGQSEWSTTVDFGKPYIVQFGDVIFHTTKNGAWPYSDSTTVLACDSQKGNWRELLKFRNTNFEDYEVSFHNPAAFINDVGDTLLILKLEQITIAPFDSRLDLYCYNMTQDTMVWGHRQFDPYGGANILPPLIEGDYIYYVGVFEVYCLDKNTGEVQWKWGYPETRHSLQGNNFLLYQDKLIIKRGNGLLYALDKHTGAEQWVQEDAGSSGTEMRIYGNRLYFGSGKIFIIDLDTGETIYKIRNPNLSARFPQADFLNAITVDEENQRMYTTDGYFLMCMRLPE